MTGYLYANPVRLALSESLWERLKKLTAWIDLRYRYRLVVVLRVITG